MELHETTAIQQACAGLLSAYAFALDGGNAADLVQLFAIDGVLRSAGKVLRGHGEIPQIIGERPADLVLRHHLTTLNVRVVDASHAVGRVYYLLYRANGEAPLPMPAQPFSAGEWKASFARAEAGWVFAELEIQRLFSSAIKPL
jgi:hypothetical protein